MRYLVIAILALLTLSVKAQTDKATTQRIVEAKNFTFIASSAIPMNSTEINNILSRMPGAASGGIINLTSGSYDVRITPDSIVAYLPYYGRAFNASYGNRDDNGFKFTSTKFSYEKVARKKGGW